MTYATRFAAVLALGVAVLVGVVFHLGRCALRRGGPVHFTVQCGGNSFSDFVVILPCTVVSARWITNGLEVRQTLETNVMDKL
jgi:hypothetical protein